MDCDSAQAVCAKGSEHWPRLRPAGRMGHCAGKGVGGWGNAWGLCHVGDSKGARSADEVPGPAMAYADDVESAIRGNLGDAVLCAFLHEFALAEATGAAGVTSRPKHTRSKRYL